MGSGGSGGSSGGSGGANGGMSAGAGGGWGGTMGGGAGYNGDAGGLGTAGTMSGGAGGAGMAGYGGGGLAGVAGSGWGGGGGAAGLQPGVIGQGTSFGTPSLAPGYGYNKETGTVFKTDSRAPNYGTAGYQQGLFHDAKQNTYKATTRYVKGEPVVTYTKIRDAIPTQTTALTMNKSKLSMQPATPFAMTRPGVPQKGMPGQVPSRDLGIFHSPPGLQAPARGMGPLGTNMATTGGQFGADAGIRANPGSYANGNSPPGFGSGPSTGGPNYAGKGDRGTGSGGAGGVGGNNGHNP